MCRGVLVVFMMNLIVAGEFFTQIVHSLGDCCAVQLKLFAFTVSPSLSIVRHMRERCPTFHSLRESTVPTFFSAGISPGPTGPSVRPLLAGLATAHSELRFRRARPLQRMRGRARGQVDARALVSQIAHNPNGSREATLRVRIVCGYFAISGLLQFAASRRFCLSDSIS